MIFAWFVINMWFALDKYQIWCGIVTWLGFLYGMVRWKLGSFWGVMKWKHCWVHDDRWVTLVVLDDSWKVLAGVLDGWVHLTQVHLMWWVMTSEDGLNGLKNGFWWTDGLKKSWKCLSMHHKILLVTARLSHNTALVMFICKSITFNFWKLHFWLLRNCWY